MSIAARKWPRAVVDQLYQAGAALALPESVWSRYKLDTIVWHRRDWAIAYHGINADSGFELKGNWLDTSSDEWSEDTSRRA